MHSEYILPSPELLANFPEELHRLLTNCGDSSKKHPITLPLGAAPQSPPYTLSFALKISAAATDKTATALHLCLLSLLCRYSPEELQLLLFAPFDSPLQQYHKLPHLLCPISQTTAPLYWVINEAKHRCTLLDTQGAKSIIDYNAAAAPAGKLSPIIAVIDAHHKNGVNSMLRDQLEQLAALNDCCERSGIHIIIYTDTHQISHVEQALQAGTSTVRPACHMQDIPLPTFTEQVISTIVQHCATQAKQNFAPPEPEQPELSAQDTELFERCVEFAAAEGKVSTAVLQRKFSIGYGRAAKMMDFLTTRGIIDSDNRYIQP